MTNVHPYRERITYEEMSDRLILISQRAHFRQLIRRKWAELRQRSGIPDHMRIEEIWEAPWDRSIELRVYVNSSAWTGLR